MNSTAKLGTESIPKLIMQFSLPSIIAMLVNAIYNIVDRLFVGNYASADQVVNELALGGLAVVFPLVMVLFAFGALFGIGGSTLIAIKFGEQNKTEPNLIYGNMISLGILSNIIMITVVAIFLEPLLRLVGATSNNLPYAFEYTRIILVGMIPQTLAFAYAALARTEGHPRLAMASQLIAAGTNIFLDWLFIVVFGWGVAGAAWGTVISQCVSLLILSKYFFFKKQSILTLKPANLLIKWRVLKNICVIGFASFLINIGNSLSSAFTIVALRKYGSDAAITALGAINSIFTVLLMPILGMQQGLTPIMGYNHGMKRPDRVWKTLWVGIGISVAYASIFVAVTMIWPEFFLSFFITPDSETLKVAVNGLLYQFVILPLIPITVLSNSYFQATAKGGIALVLSSVRQAAVIPLVLLLPLIWGLNGVWLTAPITDIIPVIFTSFFLINIVRKRQHKVQLSVA